MFASFDADIAIHNVFGGIRKGLPAGDLTYGAVYEMFPFDNIVSIHEISGEDLRSIIAWKVAPHVNPGFDGHARLRYVFRHGHARQDAA